jgi:HK97 family phage prohead protease
MNKMILGAEIKARDEGVIEGYGSVFGNIDLGGDIVQKGAFAGSLLEKRPMMFFGHDPDKILGVWDSAEEDDHGLKLVGRVNMETQIGRETHSNIKMVRDSGAKMGLSIGYRTQKAKNENGARVIEAADLMEVSVVSLPMNTAAAIDAVKAADMSPSEMERRLRDAGFSRNVAKAMMADGFKAVQGLRDADDGLEEQAALAKVFAAFS